MRPVLSGLVAAGMVCQAAVLSAQQGSVQITGAAQGVTGTAGRGGIEHPLEPDFGVSWLQPGTRFGAFQIELRGARRADRLHLGRNYAALRDVKYRGLSWTLEAGDTHFTRAMGEYGFANLTTPSVTFSGGAITGRSTRSSVHLVGGRTTAWRSIFGNDPDSLGQWIGMARATHRLSDRFEVTGRAARIKTSNLREFAFSIADSRQAGGGVRFTLTPALQLIADGSFVDYRRVDASVRRRDGSVLLGANLLLARGWLQVNAARFSPGEFPAMNDPLHDRETVFAAGEYDVWRGVRLFGGWDVIRTNIDPDLSTSASRNLPRTVAARGFGGARVLFGNRSAFTFRAEGGDRVSRPVAQGFLQESDTGSHSAEWQATFGAVTTYARYGRRENIDRVNTTGTFTQSDVSGQVFLRASPSTQLFGLGTFTRHETGDTAGSTYWQLGGGAQVQVLQRNLWLRGEGTTSRNVDLLTRDFVPRESFAIGMVGEIARGTTLAFNMTADRTPQLFARGSPWTTRSMVRVTQRFSTGATRVAAVSGASAAATRARGTGTILGAVFTDWNANGIQEPDEAPLENIPVRIEGVSAVTTRRDGEFSFLNVPAGPQEVGLDTSAIPIDFDPPAESVISVELDRGVTRRVTFGLVPLGMVRGRVFQDANRNGRIDPGETPIEGAILVLDGGARSEQVRRGAYRFESIRSGDHVVSLLPESLPEGAVITGASEVPLALRRDQLTVEVNFTVSIEKRPENRRVFPPRGGASPQKPETGPAGAGAAISSTTAARASNGAGAPRSVPSARSTPAASARRIVTAPSGTAAPGFVVQVAALLDPVRARDIVRQLTDRGYPAYLVAPPPEDPDGPYRVRVGRYPTRGAADAVTAKIERARGEKAWVIREGAVTTAVTGRPGPQ